MTLLSRSVWLPLAQSHRERVAVWTEPRLARRRLGQKDPVDDFLFEYYTFRPGQLARWHPGYGVGLESPVPELAGIAGFRERAGYIEVDPTKLTHQRASAQRILRLLTATAGRKPMLGCSALHEWAMVYRIPPDQIRHAHWPLRLAMDEIADVVDDVGLRCSHFDAFRFFTAEAAPRNPWQLTRADQLKKEQPGCLHATMDLYKWSYQLAPLLSMTTVADAFELARRGRTLDMASSPYDLRQLGITPIEVETPSGRAEFARRQRDLAVSGQEFRARLTAEITAALAA